MAQNMDENRIRQMIQQEMRRSDSGARFGMKSIPFHTHDGVNSQPIKAENIVPSTSVVGRIAFDQATTYTLNLNSSFTPSNIQADGIAYELGGTPRCMVQGYARLTPSFYFNNNINAGTNDVVVFTQNIQFPLNNKPAQGGSFLYTVNGSNTHYAGATNDHIVSIFTSESDPSTITARVTVVDFSRSAITIDVPILSTNWIVVLNFVIT